MECPSSMVVRGQARVKSAMISISTRKISTGLVDLRKDSPIARGASMVARYSNWWITDEEVMMIPNEVIVQHEDLFDRKFEILERERKQREHADAANSTRKL
jgi:hypothetical protein